MIALLIKQTILTQINILFSSPWIHVFKDISENKRISTLYSHGIPRRRHYSIINKYLTSSKGVSYVRAQS